VWLLLLIMGARVSFLRGFGEPFVQCSDTYRILRFEANKLYRAGIPQFHFRLGMIVMTMRRGLNIWVMESMGIGK
jgi:hypothetical protein